jgi:DNA-directed RNA polymerase specialized sigma24 family protein
VYAISLYRSDRVIAGTGQSATHLAGDVIVQLFEGKISYDGRRPLLPLLKKALYHDFLDLKKSASRRTTVILEAKENEDGEVVGGLESLPAEEQFQPDVLFREIVYRAIGDDQELFDYAFAILECGAVMPADIASLLGISTDDVENRRKRLRRRLAPVLGRPEA